MKPIIKVGIGVLILKDDKILLGHRTAKAKETGGIYEPDTWCLPGGKQEFDETIQEGAIRETKEETNLDIDDLQIFGAMDDIQPGKHFVTIHVIANACQGKLKVMEPEKQDTWKWFPIDELPNAIYTPSQHFINAYKKHIKESRINKLHDMPL